MSNNNDHRFVLSIPIRWEISLFIIIFGLAIFVRFLHLSADPPYGFTVSTGIETDPPGHTLFARNAVLTNDWNPYEDKRFITYHYSLISGAAWVVYQLFGIGVYQINLISVIFSLLSLFLFYLVLRKSNGNGTALLALFFLAINYIGIFIGRRPLLENGMNFLFIMALFCLTYGEKRLWGHFLFGFFAAAAIFFGKVIALAFLAVPAVYYIYKIAFLKKKAGYRQFVACAGGFSILSLAWYLFVFAPHSSEVSGYMAEQIFGLHGSPEALASVSKFVWKLLVFGMKSAFFERMPAISVASLFFIVLLGSRIFDRDRVGTKNRYDNLILISITVWLVGTFAGELPWNYLPLRYLCAMIYPLSALTAVFIVYLYNLNEKANILNRSIVFNIILFILTLILGYQIVRFTVTRLGGLFIFKDDISAILAGVLLIVFAYFMISWKKRNISLAIPRYFRYSIIGLILVVSVYSHASNYLSWAKCPIHTMRQASHDLGLLLSPAAVVSGPYGPALTLENELGAIIHYFGTTRPDPTLFKRFPVTHLALDRSNEDVARRIYPEIMKCARLVCKYNINCKRVSVYNISHCTGNADAITYNPTIFEKAILYFAANRAEPGIASLNQFVRAYPENMSGHTWAGIHCLEIEDFDMAIEHFKKAVDFSYTDFNLHFFLGNAYIGKSYESGEDRYRIMAESEINLARTFSLGKFVLDDYIIKDPKDRENGRNGK